MAQLHCLNVPHDVEANGFFVDLALASRDLFDQGLYHLIGEAAMRIAFRNGTRRSRLGEGAPASDGWGRFLTPSGLYEPPVRPSGELRFRWTSGSRKLIREATSQGLRN
jgi:hypothetical protein